MEESKESGLLRWSRKPRSKKLSSLIAKDDVIKPPPSGAIPVLKPEIVYRVEYRDTDDKLISRRSANEPLKDTRDTSSLAALELTQIVAVTDRGHLPADTIAESGGEADSNEGPKAQASIPDGTYVTGYVLEINSPYIMNALQEIVKYYPDKSLLGPTLTVESPFRLLFHYVGELRDYRAQHQENHSQAYKERSNRDLDILIKFMDESDIVASVREELARHNTLSTCKYDHLWTLFKPGEMCYVREKDHLSGPFTVARYMVNQPTNSPVEGFTVTLWNIQFNGKTLGRVIQRHPIATFDDTSDERSIESLNVVPARYFEAEPSRQQMIERGKKYWKLAKDFPAYREYNGKTFDSPSQELLGQRGRVILDPEAVERDFLGLKFLDEAYPREYDASIPAGCRCDACTSLPGVSSRPFLGYDNCDPKKDNPPGEDLFYALCAGSISGIALKDGAKHVLDVMQLSEVERDESPFEQLVLPHEVKDTVKALTASLNHEQKKQNELSADFITGKGEGKIILLHGPPGTGKTATAEAISAMSVKPLLPLTCGGLGITAMDVEIKLNQYLSWGEKWDAIVLLDEADIYLQERNLNDVKRNSLVSVFLRELEYYKGLLVITTNRVKTFDEAFLSRVHVSLYYPVLEHGDRTRIWNNHFARMGSKVEIDREAKEFLLGHKSVIELKWNGREIRNAFSTAVALAQYQAQRSKAEIAIITLDHVERVAKLSNGFKHYMKKMNNQRDPDYIAKANLLRTDGYHSQGN